MINFAQKNGRKNGVDYISNHHDICEITQTLILLWKFEDREKFLVPCICLQQEDVNHS